MATFINITDSIRTGIATVAHNRPFTSRDLAEYRGLSTATATAIVKKLVKGKMLRKVPDGWYPTSMGWDWIEGKQFTASDYDAHGMRSYRR